jgi:hypothetical protein
MTIKEIVEQNITYISALDDSENWTFDGIMFMYEKKPYAEIKSKKPLTVLTYWGRREGVRLKIGRNKMQTTTIDQDVMISDSFIEAVKTYDSIMDNDFIVEEKIHSLFKKKKRNKSKVMKLYIEGWSVKDIGNKLNMSDKMVGTYVTATRKEVNALLGTNRKSVRVVKYKSNA